MTSYRSLSFGALQKRAITKRKLEDAATQELWFQLSLADREFISGFGTP
jgi:hypothetical protein